MPTFGNNPYDNPQMGWQGSPNGQPQVADGTGKYGYGPGYQGYEPQGYDPSSSFTGYEFQPMQGQQPNFRGQGGQGSQSGFQGYDPQSNFQGYNPQSNFQGYNPSQYQGQDVTPGQGYGGFDYASIGSGIDPSAVIAAQESGLNQRMESDMAAAGGRAGASGFGMSTPYSAELGKAAQTASNERSAMTLQYQNQAAQAQAQRDLAQQQQAAQLDFGGWQTGYQGDLQSQMFNQGQGLSQWGMENQMGMQNAQMANQFGMFQDQMGMQGAQMANQYGLAQDQMGMQNAQMANQYGMQQNTLNQNQNQFMNQMGMQNAQNANQWGMEQNRLGQNQSQFQDQMGFQGNQQMNQYGFADWENRQNRNDRWLGNMMGGGY